MNSQQIKKMEILQTVDNYLTANREIWSAIPIIDTYKKHLSQVIESIKNALTDQTELSAMSGTTLQQLRIIVAEKMDILDDILEAYAEDTGNSKLLGEADNSKSDYLRLTNDGFERKVSSVLKLLDENLSEMLQYGINTNQIEEAKNSFHSFREKRSKPATYQETSEETDESINSAIEEGMQTVDKINKVMVRFRSSHPSFFNGFKSAIV